MSDSERTETVEAEAVPPFTTRQLLPDRHTPGALVRLRREVAVARDASSPRLVRIFDIGTAAEGIYLTMEVLGGSLKDRLRGGALPIAEAVRIASELLEGLAALH